MDGANRQPLEPGASVLVIRRYGHLEGRSQGIIAVRGNKELDCFGLRVAGSPAYREGEQVTVVVLGETAHWAVDCHYVLRHKDVQYFEPLSEWYRFERRVHERFEANIPALVTAPGGREPHRATVIDLSEGGAGIRLCGDSPGDDLDLILPNGDTPYPLPCRVLRSTFSDDGVTLHVAFRRLDEAQRAVLMRHLVRLGHPGEGPAPHRPSRPAAHDGRAAAASTRQK